MSKMIQVRNVPDDVHRRLKVRAASEGRSPSDYLLAEMDRVAPRPTLAEMGKRLAGGRSTDVGRDEIVASFVRIARSERRRSIDSCSRIATSTSYRR
ncbi:MAG: hypothetical protein AVDCRST_MAG45-2152 [uncultured Solirubrobacterales bacterium]|uniref:Antitoxin FitA-like ribbon-helix-helix domain-containing protein n=1 Tax=uncultured Solirubrobacterales bacterium TaxID=768556 RepID=A0A6J4T710_9ACTN|nr:MAG: hypothetical protein AVDCRST_MAG45-2152 [uncultured Solirubrobacterales bacterium]